MARVNVEARALREDAPLFRRMGHLLGVSSFDVYGRWLFVWHHCQLHLSAHLSADEIDGAADLPGFTAAAITVGLAEEQPEGVYIRGMGDRIEELKSYLDRSAKGAATTNARRTPKRRRANKMSLASAAVAAAATAATGTGLSVSESLLPPGEDSSSKSVEGPEKLPEAKTRKKPFRAPEMVDAIAESSSGKFDPEVLDRGMWPAIERMIARLEDGITLEDCKLVGAWIGGGGLSFMGHVGASWLAKTGNFAEALAKARNSRASPAASKAKYDREVADFYAYKQKILEDSR